LLGLDIFSLTVSSARSDTFLFHWVAWKWLVASCLWIICSGASNQRVKLSLFST
jgi:hypothetical protein